MDFRTPHTVGSRINEPFQQLINGAGYDHCYVLNKRETEALVFAAKCIETGKRTFAGSLYYRAGCTSIHSQLAQWFHWIPRCYIPGKKCHLL